MASWKNAYPGAYLKKENLTGDFSAVIKAVKVEEVGSDDDKERKLVIHFNESPPGCDVSAMVCNKTNCGIIEEVLHTDDIDLWIGKRITIFNNPGITFGGKRVGGISVRDTLPAGSGPSGPSDDGPHPKFQQEESAKYPKWIGRAMLAYNAVLAASPQEAAEVPEKFLRDKNGWYQWDTVLRQGTGWITAEKWWTKVSEKIEERAMWLALNVAPGDIKEDPIPGGPEE